MESQKKFKILLALSLLAITFSVFFFFNSYSYYLSPTHKNAQKRYLKLSGIPDQLPINENISAGKEETAREEPGSMGQALGAPAKVPPVEGQNLWGLRILYTVAMYDFRQYLYTETMIDSCRDMCEGGAWVTFVLQTTTDIPDAMMQLFDKRQYCTNPVGGFEIIIDKYNPNVKLTLSQKHRVYMYDRLDDYDFFIYSEDDMHLRPSHISAYLEETRLLDEAIPEMFSKDYKGTRYMISVIRWESAFDVEDLVAKGKEAAKKIRDLGKSTRVYWENFVEDYDVVDVKPGLGPYVTMKLPHTAMWMLTKKQMIWLRDTCKFHLTRPDPKWNTFKRTKDQPPVIIRGKKMYQETFTVRVWVSSLQFNKCGIKRVFPLDLIETFGIHHLPDKNWKRKVGGGSHRGATSKIIGDQHFYQKLSEMSRAKGIANRTIER